MATPALTASNRYFDPELTRIYFVASIASKSAPTRAEMNAGVNVTGEVAEISGFTTSSEQIATPDLASRYTSQIGGRTSAEDSSLTFYADQQGDDVRATLARGTTGFLLFLDGGDVEGNKMDCYPITVISVGKMRSVGDEAARLQVQFSITSEPAEDIEVPAA